MRLEGAKPTQHPLLAVAKMPVAEWSEEVLAEFLEAACASTPSAKALLAALTVPNLKTLIELLRAEEP